MCYPDKEYWSEKLLRLVNLSDLCLLSVISIQTLLRPCWKLLWMAFRRRWEIHLRYNLLMRQINLNLIKLIWDLLGRWWLKSKMLSVKATDAQPPKAFVLNKDNIFIPKTNHVWLNRSAIGTLISSCSINSLRKGLEM